MNKITIKYWYHSYLWSIKSWVDSWWITYLPDD
jgi:hypothetical protein